MIISVEGKVTGSLVLGPRQGAESIKKGTHLREQLRPAFVWCMTWFLMFGEGLKLGVMAHQPKNKIPVTCMCLTGEGTVFQSSKFLNKDTTRGAKHCFSQTSQIWVIWFINWMGHFLCYFSCGAFVLKEGLSGRVDILHVWVGVWVGKLVCVQWWFANIFCDTFFFFHFLF